MKGYQEEFIYNLKKYRKERKLTQAQLSELCDVANGTIANIECGLSKPSFDLILTIATVLCVHPALLFSSNPIQNLDRPTQNRRYKCSFYLECLP